MYRSHTLQVKLMFVLFNSLLLTTDLSTAATPCSPRSSGSAAAPTGWEPTWCCGRIWTLQHLNDLIYKIRKSRQLPKTIMRLTWESCISFFLFLIRAEVWKKVDNIDRYVFIYLVSIAPRTLSSTFKMKDWFKNWSAHSYLCCLVMGAKSLSDFTCILLNCM